MGMDVEAMGDEKASSQKEWKPTKKEMVIMITLAFISMMVALDATILVTVLPVSPSWSSSNILILTVR